LVGTCRFNRRYTTGIGSRSTDRKRCRPSAVGGSRALTWRRAGGGRPARRAGVPLLVDRILRDAEPTEQARIDRLALGLMDTIGRALTDITRRIRRFDVARVWPECPKKGDVTNLMQTKEGEFGALKVREKVKHLLDWISKAPDWEPRECIIRIVAGEMPRMVQEAERALINAGTPVFVRSDVLVFPVHEKVPASDKRETVSVKLRSVVKDLLLRWLAEVATFQKFNKKEGDWVTSDPPAQLATSRRKNSGPNPLDSVAGRRGTCKSGRFWA
jgi:hypothetical protein